MNPRHKLLVGYITDYFMNNSAPAWRQIGPALKRFDVKSLFAGEILPEDFLKMLFVNDETLLKQIPEFIYRHHQIIMMLMKEEYSLTSCIECGYYTRSVGFNWRRRFQSFQDLDEIEAGTTCPPSTPDTMILEQSPKESMETETTRKEAGKEEEEEEEIPKLKKCCKHFNHVF